MLIIAAVLLVLSVVGGILRHRPVTDLDRKLSAIDAELSGEVRPRAEKRMVAA